MKKFLKALYRFSSSWTGTVIIVLGIIFFVAQSFVIPSGSMKRSLLIGDFLFVKKFSYGIPLPEIPWIGLKVFPDLHGNGHLFEGARPQREDIVVFYVPTDGKTHYVKRCVAVGGDELLYYDKHLLIHMHEGDAWMRAHYPQAQTVRLLGKLWLVNPYRSRYPGIQYRPEYQGNLFLSMLYRSQGSHTIDMKPVMIDTLDAPIYSLNGQPVNAFYKKVEPDHYYMIGDNRDNSEDSRIWGSVPYRLIIGQPWIIYFSMEYRSYERVMYGNRNGSGRDHQALRAICGDSLRLDSPECAAKWNAHRYAVRWGRIGHAVDTIQRKEPIDD
jgi:signal peptidase I